MQSYLSYYRDIRAGYPDSLYEDDETRLAWEWADTLLSAPDARKLLFEVMLPVVKGLLSQERREAERQAQRAEREDADEVPSPDQSFGDWERKTEQSRSSRRRRGRSDKPYVDERVNRRIAYLNRVVAVEGFGKVAWRDMTDEMLTARIAMYDTVIAGAKSGRQFVVERRILLRETGDAKTLGEAYELRGETFPEPPADDLAA